MNNVYGSDQVFVLSRSGSGHVLRFDMSFGTLSKKPELEIWKPILGLKDFSCVGYRHYIFIIGGYHIKLKRCVEQVKRYDVNANEWTDFPPMSMERRMCTAIAFKNEIIVCGGFRTNNKLLVTSEILNINRRKWRKCSPLKKAKADHQLLVVDDAVFGMGGVQEVVHNGETVFCASDSIFEFNDSATGWQALDDNLPLILGKPVYLHSMVTIDSKIYIIGGLKTVIDNCGNLSEVINDKVESLSLGNSQVKCYNRNDLKGWVSPWDRSLPAPAISRYGAAAVVIGHDIYLIGGTSEKNSSGVYSVERFHSKQSQWTQEFDLKQEGDLSLVCGVKIFGSKYKYHFRKDLTSATVQSTSTVSEKGQDEEEEEDIGHRHYRVGWVLW